MIDYLTDLLFHPIDVSPLYQSYYDGGSFSLQSSIDNLFTVLSAFIFSFMTPAEVEDCIRHDDQKAPCVIVHCRDMALLESFLSSQTKVSNVLSIEFYKQLEMNMNIAFKGDSAVIKEGDCFHYFVFSKCYRLSSYENEILVTSSEFLFHLFQLPPNDVQILVDFYSTSEYGFLSFYYLVVVIHLLSI